MHPDDQAQVVRAMRAITRGRTDRYVGEHRWVRKDGRVVHLRSHVGVVRDPDGEVRNFVMTRAACLSCAAARLARGPARRATQGHRT